MCFNFETNAPQITCSGRTSIWSDGKKGKPVNISPKRKLSYKQQLVSVQQKRQHEA